MNLINRYVKILEFDQDGYEEEMYNEFLDSLDESLKKMNPSCIWHVEGKNMGWMKRSGHTDFSAYNASEFLRAILPKCVCSGKIEISQNKMLMTVYHHDAPTGESYEVSIYSKRREEI